MTRMPPGEAGALREIVKDGNLMKNLSHILIVDDEEVLRNSLSLIARRAGYKVSVAASGIIAIGKLLDFLPSDNPIDFLLVDIHMPDLTGWELMDTLYRRKIILPVLFMSGDDSQKLEGFVNKETPAGFIWKPFKEDQLLDQIQILLRKAIN